MLCKFDRPFFTCSSACFVLQTNFFEEVCIPGGSPFQQFGHDHADYHDLDNTKISLRYCADTEWAFETISATTSEQIDTTATTGTKINAGDDTCHERTILPFSFFGTTYTVIAFCSNGYLRFGSTLPLGPVENTAVFQSVKMIAAIWNDFMPQHDSQTHKDLYHETVGHLEKFRWHMLPQDEGGVQGVQGANTFMVILNTQDGSIDIIHNKLSSGSGIVGVSNGADSDHVPVDLAPNGQSGDHNVQSYCTGTSREAGGGCFLRESLLLTKNNKPKHQK